MSPKTNLVSAKIAIATLTVVLMLGGCATPGMRVVTDYDPAVDFDEFRTFQFASPLSSDARGQRTSVSVQLIAATTRELQDRGLQLVTSGGHLRVDLRVGTPWTTDCQFSGGQTSAS